MKRQKSRGHGSDNNDNNIDINTDASSTTHTRKKIATMACGVQPSLPVMADLNALSTPKAAVPAGPADFNENSYSLQPFRLFPDLPHEIQDEVWSWACYSSPNIIGITINREVVRFIAIAMTVPAILRATSGSRGIGLRHYALVEDCQFYRGNHQIQQQQQPFLVPQQMQLLQLLPGGLQNNLAGLLGHPIRGTSVRNAMPRYFYLNIAFDIFHLRIGSDVDHIFPTYVLQPPGQPGVISSAHYRTEYDRQGEISRLNHWPFVAREFPHIGKIPAAFNTIKHLALNFSLPTCTHPYSSSLWLGWVEVEVKKFLDRHVKTTTKHFEALSNIDLVVKRAYGTEEEPTDEESTFKDWRDVPIRMSDGRTFGYVEFAFVEREIRMWFMEEFLGRNDEAPAWRLVVKVPDASKGTK